MDFVFVTKSRKRNRGGIDDGKFSHRGYFPSSHMVRSLLSTTNYAIDDLEDLSIIRILFSNEFHSDITFPSLIIVFAFLFLFKLSSTLVDLMVFMIVVIDTSFLQTSPSLLWTRRRRSRHRVHVITVDLIRHEKFFRITENMICSLQLIMKNNCF